MDVMGKKILLIEDEPGLVLTLSDRLAKEGYGVDVCRDGARGLQAALTGAFDVIVLDVMLPKKSGFDVCRDLRQHGVTTPVLMLTARSQVVDRVVGLKLGADDYLAKPFDMLELLARLEALLRRPVAAAGTAVYQTGSLRIDVRSTTVRRNGKPVVLSAREFQLLRYFAEHPGRTISREELLKEVWGYKEAPNTRTVDVHVAWLRQKIEDDPKHPSLIRTVPGFGYQFTTAP
jgi:two-component system, OmpR family, alkaline phosphatase synthesis response regulator PhoP